MAGRTALITGSTGIAEASAELFAAEGARVFVVSRTEEHCRTLVEGLTAGGAEAAWFAADLEDEHAADAAVAAAVDRFGRLDALFNVAGGSGRRFGDGPIHEMTMDGWERTMALNTRTHMTMSRAVVRRMLDAGTGCRRQPRRDPQHGQHPRLLARADAVPDPRLRGIQGSHRGLDPDDGRALRPPGHPGQRGRAGADHQPHVRACRGRRRDPGVRASSASRCRAASCPPRMWQPRPCSCSHPRVAPSRARCSWWMAAGRSPANDPGCRR